MVETSTASPRLTPQLSQNGQALATQVESGGGGGSGTIGQLGSSPMKEGAAAGQSSKPGSPGLNSLAKDQPQEADHPEQSYESHKVSFALMQSPSAGSAGKPQGRPFAAQLCSEHSQPAGSRAQRQATATQARGKRQCG